jgi:DNA-binding MarR family transcriptional regulator
MDDTKKITAVMRDFMEAFTFRSMEAWRHFMKSNGLSGPQMGILMHLYHAGTHEVHAIGRHMDITSAAASQLVDRLAQEGLVARSESAEDRRVRRITITEKGRALIGKGISERTRWVEGFVALIPKGERARVYDALPVMIATERKLPPLHLPHPEGGCNTEAAGTSQGTRRVSC